MGLRSFIFSKLFQKQSLPKKFHKKDNEQIDFDVIDAIIREIISSPDLNKVGQSIVDTMVQYLGSAGGILFLKKEPENYIYSYSTYDTEIAKKVLKMLPKPFREHKYSLEKGKMTLIGKTLREKKHFISKKFEDFISPEVSFKMARLIQRLADVKISISLPTVMDGKAIGVLFIAFNDRKEISKHQISILELFANQAAIAINNALKYQELLNLYELEKETAALLTHELKTPIAIAHHSAQRLSLLIKNHDEELGDDLTSKFESAQQEIQKGMDRMNAICNSIFSLREVENQLNTKLQKLDLKHSLKQICENAHKEASKRGLDFSCEVKIRAKNRYGAGVQFEQILMILLDNALKYTQNGSIHGELILNKRTLKCTITDTGIGISQEHQSNIFGRFKRIKNKKHKVQGLGLGLYIAKRIVDQVDGNIQVQDNPKGKGAQFIVKIPVYDSPRAIKKAA